jgi:hypothetical protein
MGWIINKKWARYKTSVYLRKDIYERVTRAAQANELSFSAQLNIIVERGIG